MTNTRNILTIIALSALGLCLFVALAKMAVKSDKTKKSCDNVCGMLVFIAAVLLAVAQFVEDSKPEKFHEGKPHDHSSSSGNQMNAYGGWTSGSTHPKHLYGCWNAGSRNLRNTQGLGPRGPETR